MAALLITAFTLIFSIFVNAPLLELANFNETPNPSKAPWYFLGLQEMLVYFDPWYAGVVLPTLIVVGLMAIPYIDTNPKGNGYYTFAERRHEIEHAASAFRMQTVKPFHGTRHVAAIELHTLKRKLDLLDQLIGAEMMS